MNLDMLVSTLAKMFPISEADKKAFAEFLSAENLNGLRKAASDANDRSKLILTRVGDLFVRTKNNEDRLAAIQTAQQEQTKLLIQIATLLQQGKR